jgi:hypothetical protein
VSEIVILHVFRQKTGEVEAIPTVVETRALPDRGIEQSFEPPLVLGAGDEVLDWPPITVTFS